MMVVDTGSRGPLWIFCLGPRQTGQGADGAVATRTRTPVRDVCPHDPLSKNEMKAKVSLPATYRAHHHKTDTFRTVHVSNTEWQGGGRNTGEVTAPEWPPGHQGAVGGSLWCINQTPCGTMRGPELQAGPEAAGSDMETQGDPACANLPLPLPRPVTTRLSSSAAKLHSPPPLSSAN